MVLVCNKIYQINRTKFIVSNICIKKVLAPLLGHDVAESYPIYRVTPLYFFFKNLISNFLYF